MGQYLLGIDIGTSACKVAVFDRGGNALSSTNGNYKVYYPQPGYAQQRPDDWWTAVCQATKEAISAAGVAKEEIAGVGIDGQGWAAVMMDKEGNVLAQTPLWMDTRSAKICDEIKKELPDEEIVRLCGNSLQPMYTTGKVRWYEQEMPEVYKDTYQVLQSNCFIAYRLTGNMVQDKCQAYGWHCFDMHKGVWDEGRAKELGIPVGFLPELVECHQVMGKVTAQAAEQCGLMEGTPVVAGGLDAACGALGVGVLHAGDTQEQGGQAGGMSICTEDYKSDARLILSYHVVPDRWLLQGGTTGGGGVMRWLEQQFGDYEREMCKQTGKKPLIVYNELAEAVPPGCEGLVMLPYMSGERSPIWNPKAKGVYYGLDFSKTKGHFIRAGMEGVAYSLRHNLAIAQQAGAEVKVLRSMGGSANSLLWTQIKSDITGKPIIVPNSDTATTLGAAILAGVGIGYYDSFQDAVDTTIQVKREHQPNPANKQIYDETYHTYLRLYEELKGMMV
ncbi:MAG: xylulokinase [Blautia sp.]|jgi:xylulokinase